MKLDWWNIGQTCIANGGQQVIVRVGERLFAKTNDRPFRPLNVTFVEQTPTPTSHIGIIHFEDTGGRTTRIGTMVCEPTTTTVCYNGHRPNIYAAALVSERDKAQLLAASQA